MIAGADASAAHTMGLRKALLRIGLLPFSTAGDTNQHSNVAQGCHGQKHFLLGRADAGRTAARLSNYV
jgi:hypothetical protein